MAVHDKYAALALSKIAKHGRTMTLSKTSDTPADPARPENGTGVASSRSIVGLVTEFTVQELERDPTRRGFRKLLVAASAHVGYDLETYDTLIDGSFKGCVSKDEVLQPGTTRIMYTLRVKQ